MSTPRAGDITLDFVDALYGKVESDEEVQLDDEEDETIFFDDEVDFDREIPSPIAPPYSPITRHSTPQPPRDRSRSRSPLNAFSPCIVLTIFDEDGTPLPSSSSVPDSVVPFEITERISDNNRGRSLRGRARSGRRGRMSSRGQHRGRRGARSHRHGWQPGQPLEEIYMSDDDVPAELREMVMDFVRRRQERRVVGGGDEAFHDASDEYMGGSNNIFSWSPMGSFQSEEETFLPERTGSVYSYTNPYDAFRSFWDDSILQHIVEETNRHAGQIASASFQADWHATNVHELLCLFAFWMMTGIIRMPTIRSYFTSNPLLKTAVFTRIFTQRRYVNLSRALNFVDSRPNPTRHSAPSRDAMFLLNPIIDNLNEKFQHNYVMSKDICIDESLTLWKGKLRFKQYIRSKAAKFGIKTFELCESATGYLWSLIVYTGKESCIERGLAKSTSVVQKLMQPLLNKGYRLFMDNWFNSPLLARYLKRNGTDCVGTLRATRADVPKLVTQAPLQEGQLVARHSGDVCVLSWQDKKRVNMISTCHGSATALAHVSSRPPIRPEQYKPQSILDYNRCMGGVDLKDQMLEPYLLERKRCSKWYHKLFKRMLNSSIHNSRILLESSLQARQDNLTFRLELVNTILTRHHSLVPLSRKASSAHSRTAIFNHIVHHTHWPVRVPQTENDRAKNQQSRKRCLVCLREGRQMQKTPYQCEECKVPLCVENCFKKYHTIVFEVKKPANIKTEPKTEAS